MNTQALTLEQQDFAADHHNLVYAFLRDKKLRRDEFYDVVVFGYLRAVRKYLNREDLRRYAFSTIAWRAMECDLGNYYKQTRPARRACTVSLEAVVYDGESLTMAEVVSDGNRMMERLEASFLWDELESMLPQSHTAALRMQADGYTPREIAAAKKKPLRDIEDMLASAAESVRVLCMV